MRTVTIELFTFDELTTDKARERARQWYRNASAGDNSFSEFVIDAAREWLTALGFADIDIRFSGFWCQGDGASFTGTYSAARRNADALAKLRADRPATYTDDAGTVHPCAGNAPWHELAARFDKIAADAPGLVATLRDNGSHYVHPHSVAIECDDDAPVSGAPVMCDEFRAACRSAMVQIYRELEDAYNWENSDDYIDDTLRANEYEFTAEGVRHD